MKKIMYLAAALLVMVGCKNNEEVTAPQTTKGVAFHKGDVVTITVGSTQAPARKANGKITTNGVEFTWSEGDELTITTDMGGVAQFTLVEGAGTNNGVFSGTMPSEGNTFEAKYEGEYVDDFQDQMYVENGIDMSRLRAIAENCEVTEEGWSEISLTVQNAAVLIFNLQCDKKLRDIHLNQVFADAPVRLNNMQGRKIASDLASLFAADGIQLSATTPTKVAMLIPVDALNIKLNPSFSFIEGYEAGEEFDPNGEEILVPIYNANRYAPVFQLEAELGQTINYPVKKWVNLTLPEEGLSQNPSRLLCAEGEKMELNFYGDKTTLQTKKIDLKIGEHTIFSKDLTEYMSLWEDDEKNFTYYDASDNNQQYDVCIRFIGADFNLHFTVTSKVSAFALSNTFTVEIDDAGEGC